MMGGRRVCRDRGTKMKILFRVLLLAAAAVAPPADAAPLNGDQIKILMSGTTVDTVIKGKGFPIKLTFDADGSLTAHIQNPQGSRRDSGKWWTDKNRLLCWQLGRLFWGKQVCATAELDGKEIVRHFARSGNRIEVPWTINTPGPGAATIIRAATADPTRTPKATPAVGALDAAAIVKLMAGTTVRTKSVKGGYPASFFFQKDGSLSGRIDRPDKTVHDGGKWWTAKDKLLCWKFQKFGDGIRRCVTVALNGDDIVRHRGRDGTLVTANNWTIERSGTAPPAAERPTQMAQDREPPRIEAPEKVAATDAVAVFTSRIRDSSKIIEVAVNGRPMDIAPDGTVRVKWAVSQGRSTIVIAALDEWGNRSAKRVVVTRPVTAAPAPGSPGGAAPEGYQSIADIHFGNYHALVIGNNAYRELNKLATAEHDARTVAQVLKDEYGFEVDVLLNATRGDLIRALTRLRGKLTANDNLLIYYAGHGELDAVAEQGYWLPVDAEPDVPTNWISVNDVTVMVRAIRAKHILVVADSCYSGTLVRAARTQIKTSVSRHAWLKRMAKKRARTALVSGGLEPVLDGGGAGHSVFAKAFLDALRENNGVLDGQGLFNAIKRPVVVNADQTPQYSDIRHAGHDGGDFLFIRR
jgi:hypothetical protein